MMDSIQVAAIAEKLTDAQKRALTAAKLHRTNPKQFVLPVYRDRGVLVDSIVNMKLARPAYYGVVLTATGQAVRDHIKETNTNG